MNPSNSGLQEWERAFTPRVIEAKDWESQRENFTRLYSTREYSLNKVREIMANQYMFYARPKQCKTAIAKWGLGKNLKRIKMLKMLRIQDDRRLAGKSTAFRFKGQKVKKETLKRGRKRYRGTGELPEWHELQPPVSPTSDIDYFTPKASNSSDDSSSESGAPSPTVCSKQTFPRENTTNDVYLDLPNSIEEYFHLDSLAEEPSSSLSLHSVVEDKRPNESGSCNRSNQKPELPIKPHDSTSVPSTTGDTIHEPQKFPGRSAWLESPQLKPEAARALCLDCLMGGFTSHGALSAESILFEAFEDISSNQNNQSDYQISSSCTSSFCPAKFKINHPETHYFSTSLFVEQIRPVYV